ncbi:glutamyl-tRNA reductase [Microbacterium mitrae]|uniref:glutamyl-tRNA reductase n=1 Tax=Microbacterium mitrae TaxID=664640 RepID=UPI00164FBF25|nr:glutamyl-tRNA reductase [Microbacterium mitrae]
MLLCLTANHRNTEFDVLDRVARSVDAATASAFTAHDHVRGAVVLATCNRFEAYLDVSDDAEAPELIGTAALAGLLENGAELAASVTALSGDDAIRHLFSVSSGLESMVMGEDEISGQVQRALVSSREAGAVTGHLEQVFQRAATANRAVRARTDLAASGRTLVRTVLDMLELRVSDWSPIPVLIVGTGSYAATTIQSLRARGAQNLRVFSATGRAARFAEKFDVIAEDDLPDAISRARIVITCTSRYTVTTEHIINDKRRLLIDLGLPRNIDPAVGELAGIELIDLAVIGKHAELPELADVARDVVGSHTAAYLAQRAAAPAIVGFRRHIADTLATELARLGESHGSANSGENDAVERALRHFAAVLAHGPSVRAREFAEAGRLDEFEKALELVFAPRRRERPLTEGDVV